jgi:hypothetical protein
MKSDGVLHWRAGNVLHHGGDTERSSDSENSEDSCDDYMLVMVVKLLVSPRYVEWFP